MRCAVSGCFVAVDFVLQFYTFLHTFNHIIKAYTFFCTTLIQCCTYHIPISSCLLPIYAVIVTRKILTTSEETNLDKHKIITSDWSFRLYN